MAILDLKSNLSQWRKPTTVESGEKKKLSESPIKAVYSTSTELKSPTDIKINKVDNSTSIQVPGAKKIDYKFFSINSRRGRSIPAISTFFGDTILDKVSTFKKQTPETIDKASTFVKITPKGIQHVSSIEIIKTILKEKLSLYKDQFPSELLKISLYKDQLPINILKISLYKDQIPALLDKLSLYKDQIPNALNKLSLYKQFLIDNKNSIYDTRQEIVRLLRFPLTIQIYANKFLPTSNAFNDLKSGARGFIRNQKELETAFLGLDTTALTYTYPLTVKEGRLKDITKIKGALQWPLKVTFSNGLDSTRYYRTVYDVKKPYLTSSGITGETLEKYFYKTNSPSAKDIIYTKFNLRDNSFNTGLALFNQPLILTGIQRKGKGGYASELNVFDTWKFDDGFIRGGVVTSTQRAIVDTLRIGKWMSSAKGLLFITRQAGLQGAAPNTEADPLVGRRIGNGALTLISTLANTLSQHTGIRFRKDATPFVPRSTYSNVQTANKIAENVNPALKRNRLVNLKYAVIDNNATSALGGGGMPLISGPGGPQSVYGIGVTNIKRVVNSRSGLKYSTQNGVDVPIKGDKYTINNSYIGQRIISGSISPLSVNSYNSNSTPISQYTVASNKSITEGDSQQYYSLTYDNIRAKELKLNSTEIINFLLTDDTSNIKWIPTKGDFLGSTIQDYKVSSQHIRPKLSVPDYGKRGKDLRNPLQGDFMKPYTPGGNGMTDPIWKINQTDKEAVDDFVKFMFHDLNTNERFRFRAYIESVSEDFNPNWQEVKILGRADSPYIYQGFERSVSISFKAAALSRGDLMLMWDQLERLAKTTVPQYQRDYKMKGPLIKFTLGNWFINTPAFIKSLSYTVDNETPWEINLSDSGLYGPGATNDTVGELPMTVSVQVSMQIFGEVRPETIKPNSSTTPAGINESNHYSRGNLYPLGGRPANKETAAPASDLRNDRQNRFNLN